MAARISLLVLLGSYWKLLFATPTTTSSTEDVVSFSHDAECTQRLTDERLGDTDDTFAQTMKVNLLQANTWTGSDQREILEGIAKSGTAVSNDIQEIPALNAGAQARMTKVSGQDNGALEGTSKLRENNTQTGPFNDTTPDGPEWYGQKPFPDLTWCGFAEGHAWNYGAVPSGGSVHERHRLDDCIEYCARLELCSGFDYSNKPRGQYHGVNEGGGAYRCHFMTGGNVADTILSQKHSGKTWDFYVNERAIGCGN